MPDDGTQYSPYEIQITALGEALGLAEGDALGLEYGGARLAIDILGPELGKELGSSLGGRITVAIISSSFFKSV